MKSVLHRFFLALAALAVAPAAGAGIVEEATRALRGGGSVSIGATVSSSQGEELARLGGARVTVDCRNGIPVDWCQAGGRVLAGKPKVPVDWAEAYVNRGKERAIIDCASGNPVDWCENYLSRGGRVIAGGTINLDWARSFVGRAAKRVIVDCSRPGYSLTMCGDLGAQGATVWF